MLNPLDFLDNQRIFIINTVLDPVFDTGTHLCPIGRNVKASIVVQKGAIGQHAGL